MDVLAKALNKENVWECLRVAHQCMSEPDEPCERAPGEVINWLSSAVSLSLTPSAAITAIAAASLT